MKVHWLAFALVGVLAVLRPAFGAVTVPGDYSTIQAALDAVKAGWVAEGAVIEVQSGTYSEALLYADSNRGFTLRSIAGAANTIIDASGFADPALWIRNSAAAIEIDGFTLTGANSSDGGGAVFMEASPVLKNSVVEDNYTINNGGGIRLYTSNARIEACTIRNNRAENTAGGVTIVAGSNPTILDSLIEGNQSGLVVPTGFAGGVLIADSSATIQSTVVSKNQSKFAGGGLVVIGLFDSSHGAATLNLDQSVISGNTTLAADGQPLSEGGGIHIEDNALAIITDSVIADNSADQGGGIGTFRAEYQISRSVIQGNTANSGSGGGIHGFSATPAAARVSVTDSVIRRNSAVNSGGINVIGSACGAGGVCAELNLTNTLIDENQASYFGGGVNLAHAVGSFSNTSLFLNEVLATTGGGHGGGIRVVQSTLDIVNSNIAGNTAGQYGGGLFVEQGAELGLQGSVIYANSAATADDGGGIHVGSSGPPLGLVENNLLADNFGFQVREQSCPPDLPSPILSYFDNQFSTEGSYSLYRSPCWPPSAVTDIAEFNNLSPGVKTGGNSYLAPNLTTFKGYAFPAGGTILAWVNPSQSEITIEGLGQRAGSVGSIDVLPACDTSYSANGTIIQVAGTNIESLLLTDQDLSGDQVIEALQTITIENVLVAAEADITLRAKSKVTLKPPFLAEAGAAFSVSVDPNLCGL